MTNATSTILIAAASMGVLAACDPDAASRTCSPAPGTICTIAGSSRAGISGDLGPAWAARLYLPMDSAIGPDGNLYIVDWNNHRIRLVEDPLALDTDPIMSTCAGTGTLGDGPPGPALGADFNHPTDITFDEGGRMWMAAWHNSRIRRIDASLATLEDIAGTGGRAYTGDGGPAAMAVLDLPAGLEVDGAGNVFFVDQANQVIRRIDAADGTISRVAGQCITNECAPGETPSACPAPSGRWHCGADPMACALPCQPGYGGDGGPALEARFAMPFGQSADPAGRIAIADDGTLYFADTRNHRIRVITPDGSIDTFAGTGEPGFSGEGGPAEAAQLNNPVDLELGPDGTLYVADTFNSCIRAIDGSGNIHTVIGRCGMRGFAGDGGDPRMAQLDRPYGIEIDRRSGVLYVTDTHNHRVRAVMPAL